MDTGTTSAAYLQARISILIFQLRSRMVNLVDLMKPSEHHTITNTAIEQLRMDVESTALVRAAEEIMVLTRELKDLWLFAGLNTLHSHEETAADKVMEQDAKVVYDFMRETVNGRSELSAGADKALPSTVDVMEVESETT